MRSLSGPGAPVSMLLQADAADVRASEEGILVLINNDDKPQPLPTTDTLPPAAGAAFGEMRLLDDAPEPLLAAGEVRVMAVARSQPVADRTRRTGRLAEALKAPRVAIEHVTPCIDGGAFAIKRVIGQSITVEADVFTDGHDVVAAELLWKAADEKDWTRVRCEALGNDRWKAAFSPKRIGRHLFTIEGWRDDYASLCHEIEVKHKAGVGIALELTEARHYLEQVLAQAAAESAAALRAAIKVLEADDVEAAVHALTAPETTAAVAASAEHAFVVQHAPISVEVERPQAEFASWYELFPRSQSGDPSAARHVRRRDRAAARYPRRWASTSFISRRSIRSAASIARAATTRSTRGARTIPAAPMRSAARRAGTTRSIPQLGTLDDFRRLVAAAREHGLEIALDFAIQCSPDHPWLREHPGLVRLAPGRHIKYAENPPKKYEDIVNVDFYADDACPALWIALRDVVLFWVERRRAHLPRRQSAHQAAAVLGVDDRATCARAIPT